MFAQSIKNNLKFIDEYFSLLINNQGNFPQSIILYGEDIFTQYLLALNISKILNCNENRSIGCNCINCNWIKANTHPAVITVSKVDFKPDDDGSKTVISIKQTQEIKNTLSTTSEYHRVFILCDADIKTPNSEELKAIELFKSNNFNLPYEDEESGKYWIPSGINQKIFQAESANSMLKSIEEPPPRTTFIFLTKDKNDLIETIISRSQCFYVPSKYTENNDLELISKELKYYPEIDRLELNNIATNLINNAEELNITPHELLTRFQLFIKNIALANNNNPQIIEKMIKDIRILSDAQNQLKAHIQLLPALENALYRIYKNWEI